MRVYIPRSDKYNLEQHRYNELKSFCRQYPTWKAMLKDCYGLRPPVPNIMKSKGVSDPTERAVEAADSYRRKIDLVENTALEASTELYKYIVVNVTEGLGYDYLGRRGMRPPCGINQFYEARQKFFWLLDKSKE